MHRHSLPFWPFAAYILSSPVDIIWAVDKRENYQNCSVLCTTLVHSDMCTHERLLSSRALICLITVKRFYRQGSHSNLRIKIQDFSRPEMPKKLAPISGPRPMNLTAKQDTAKLKIQCQCNTSLSIATTITIALLNINDGKQECNSCTTTTAQLMCWSN